MFKEINLRIIVAGAVKSSKSVSSGPKHFLGTSELSTPTSRKANMENVQLAECIGNVRALLIEILNDDIFKDICSEDGKTFNSFTNILSSDFFSSIRLSYGP